MDKSDHKAGNRDSVFLDGWLAARMESELHNPYFEGSTEYTLWLLGFAAATDGLRNSRKDATDDTKL